MTVVNILLDTSLILASYMKATNECEEMTSDNECIVRYTQSYNTRLEILKIKPIFMSYEQLYFSLRIFSFP
jgi:hypothetical protein